MASDRMVWVDVETTGLDPQKDSLLEVGIVVSDATHLEPIDAKCWLLAGTPDPATWPEIVRDMHTKSGLIADLFDPTRKKYTLYQIAAEAVAYLQALGIKKSEEPMCGSSIAFDRKFIERDLPDFNDFFHYRNIDVSTLKELAKKRKLPVFPSSPDKAHRPIQDLLNSIAELTFYDRTLLTSPPA